MFHQPIASSTTSNGSALLVLSLIFHFSTTKHQVHFRDASFFSKKHLLVSLAGFTLFFVTQYKHVFNIPDRYMPLLHKEFF